MALFEWDKRLETGNSVLDEQHRKIVDNLNRLHEAIEAGKDPQVLDDLFYFLKAFLDSHFALEEGLIQDLRLPGLARHRAEHKALKVQIQALARRYSRGEKGPGLAAALAEFLEGYFVAHVLVEDLKLASALALRQAGGAALRFPEPLP